MVHMQLVAYRCAMDWQALADHIRHDLAERGWRQSDLAERAGVSPRAISDLLSGRPHIRIPNSVPKVAAALEWNPRRARLILQGADPDTYTDPAERQIWELTELTPARRREWIDLLRRARQDHAERSAENEA